MPSVRCRFIRTPGFVTSAIAFVTNSLVDHVEYGTPDATWIGAHAGRGVQERPANYCDPVFELYYEIPCSQEIEDESLRWMRSQIGTQYNYLDIVGLLIHDRKLTSPHSIICSQFFSDGMLRFFGPTRYLNVLSGSTYLITPEMAHLSPILAGNLKRRIDRSRRGTQG